MNILKRLFIIIMLVFFSSTIISANYSPLFAQEEGGECETSVMDTVTGVLSPVIGVFRGGQCIVENNPLSDIANTFNDIMGEDDCSIGVPFLGWIMCGILQMAVNTAFNLFSETMRFFGETNTIFNALNQDNNSFQSVLAGIRNLANLMFLFAFLLVVFQYLTNINVVDAYFVKKFLPRLIIAVILVQASWFIVMQMNTIATLLGDSIVAIIVEPVGITGPEDLVKDMNWGMILKFPSLIFIINPLFIVIALVMLISWLVLFIRQVLLIALALIAPLALACFAFPQLESFAKKWFKSYVQLLAMYPIIMGFIGICWVLAKSFMAVGSTNAIYHLMGVVLVFLPFVILPFTFKFAGGMMGTVTGKMGDLAKKGKNYGVSKGKEAYGKSSMGMERKAKKEGKLGERQIAAQSAVRKRLIDQYASTGKLPKGYSKTGMAVLSAEDAKDDVRAETAERQTIGLKRDAKQLEMAKLVEQEKKSAMLTPGMTTKSANNAALDVVAQRARRAAVDGNQDEYNAIVSYLAAQKADSQLATLQTEAATGTDATLRSAWAGAVNDSTTYGDLKGFSQHYVAPISSSQMSVADLNDQRANSVKGNVGAAATMSKEGWKAYQARFGDTEAQRLEDAIYANPTAAREYKGLWGDVLNGSPSMPPVPGSPPTPPTSPPPPPPASPPAGPPPASPTPSPTPPPSPPGTPPMTQSPSGLWVPGNNKNNQNGP